MNPSEQGITDGRVTVAIETVSVSVRRLEVEGERLTACPNQRQTGV